MFFGGWGFLICFGGVLFGFFSLFVLLWLFWVGYFFVCFTTKTLYSFFPLKQKLTLTMLLTLFRYLDYVRSRRRNSSNIFRRHEEFSLNPLPLRTEDSGLPTYEQAVTSDGQHDVPPPPYPGPPKGARVFKKSMSLPAP